MSKKGISFTQDQLTWRPWLETIDEVDATPEQVALVKEVAPSANGRPYYALLAHDVPVLRARTALFNGVMYHPGGARRSDRELSAVATSRVNGCPYCASVHARLYSQLTKDTATIQRLLDEGVETALPERERAIVDYAVKLTRTPNDLTASDLALLRQVGLTDEEVLDITYATAMFAWANRLLQTLGEPLRPVDESA